MKSYKSTIIRKYGTDVEITRYVNGTPTLVGMTKALLGRGVRNNTNMFKLATQKECIFLPTEDIQNGDYVLHTTTNEKFVVVGTHQEYDGNRVLSIVSNILKCDHLMTIKGTIKTSDSRGNLKSTFGDKYIDVPCYFEYVAGDLRQYDPGLNPEAEYKIYAVSLDIDETDRIEINLSNYNQVKKFKVLTADYISFPGMVVLEVCYDTVRK